MAREARVLAAGFAFVIVKHPTGVSIRLHLTVELRNAQSQNAPATVRGRYNGS